MTPMDEEMKEMLERVKAEAWEEFCSKCAQSDEGSCESCSYEDGREPTGFTV